jgi:hypothetical protein
MRLRLATAAAVLALVSACGSKKSGLQALPTALTCDNVVQAPIPEFVTSGMVQDLGTQPVGANLQFTIPAGTSSFVIVSQEVGRTAPATIMAQGMVLPNAVVPKIITGPDGTVYYNDFISPPTVMIGGKPYPDATGWLAVDQGFQPALGVLPFPTTSGGLDKLQSVGQVQPGTWSFTLNDWAFDCPFQSCTGSPHGGKYRVQVVTRPSPGGANPIPSTGTLDVDVYLATDPSMSLLPNAAAADPSKNALTARWKLTLSQYLSNAGITLGNVNFHDLPASVLNKYAPGGDVNVQSSDPCGPLDQLFTNATVPNRAVNVFLADGLVAPSMGSTFRVAGVDGSIPGPSGYPGTIASGAIVGLENLGLEHAPGACSGPTNLATCGTDTVAYVTAHEIGHWLGLFHTTEMEGTFFDVLTDTAPCPCFSCASTTVDPTTKMSPQSLCADVNKTTSSPTLITNGRCVVSATCGGGENLMFWLLDPRFSTGVLSTQQGEVARLNPAVR